MKKFLLFILICSSTAATNAFYSSSGKNNCYADPVNKEYIEWDSIKINGKLPLITSTSALFQLLGQPDSMITPDLNNVCTSFYDDKEYKHAFFKESLFEIYGDTAVFVSVDFRHRPDIKLITPDLTLSRTTSLVELSKLFPNTVRSRYEVNVYQIGETECIQLPLSKTVTDDSFLLFFIDGKLIRIDYFMPC